MEKLKKNTKGLISLCCYFKSMIPCNQHKEQKFYKNKDIYRSCHVFLRLPSEAKWVEHLDFHGLLYELRPCPAAS